MYTFGKTKCMVSELAVSTAMSKYSIDIGSQHILYNKKIRLSMNDSKDDYVSMVFVRY